MEYRKYDSQKDKKAVYRILNECGWVHDKKNKLLNTLIPSANTLVSSINNEVEILVHSVIGSMKYLDEELKLSAVTGVNASLCARKQGLSSKLTAIKIALDAINDADVSGLCIFDQGYYNKLGFGNGNYENVACFTPATLNINRKPKLPTRLTESDFKKVHRSRVKRKSFHGAVTLPEFITEAEMGDKKKNTGYGYFDDDGNLTHHLWFHGKGREQGPIWIKWMSYENLDQLIDLLALLKSFEEQILMVKMVEPAFINLQDFIKKPFQIKWLTSKSKHQNYIYATAFWQLRILNLENCMQKTHLNFEDINFNLKLSDPIDKYIPKSMKWNGIAGDYIINLGKRSSAEKGNKKDLPTLHASVNAFTRLWLGVMPASTLVFSDDLEAPEKLLKKLDSAFVLPKAHIDWNF